ncbi:MAG: heavy metal translocating P-type ATPase [Gemmatimonadetes bacterium]|nr:heavy metal translocating P-type ATPase [Gemmatimonadota bacterium]
MLPGALGFSAPAFPGCTWMPAAAGTAVFVYGGRPFVQGAWREMTRGAPGMMTLIALAIGVSFVFSVAVTLGASGTALWEELATLVTIMLLGHWLEMRAVGQAEGALGELAKLLPDMATRVHTDARGAEVAEPIRVADLREGDLVLVRPGEQLPADGVVRSGASEVNEAAVTGESLPVSREAGAQVVAGTLNGSGSLRVEVRATGHRTALAGIMRLVSGAQQSRFGAQLLADRTAYWLTWVALGSAVVTCGAWLLVGAAPSYAVERMVATLVVACPHALGLAIPLVVAIATSLGARHGLLVRDRRGLEEARHVDTVVFDKTGTLTRGVFGVVDVTTAPGWGAPDVLRLAGAVEVDGEHPIARGVVRSAREQGLSLPQAEAFAALPGHGVRARVEGRTVFVGGPAMVESLGVVLPHALDVARAAAAMRGQTAVVVMEARAKSGPPEACAVLALADQVRPEAKAAVRALQGTGIQVVMLTGDSPAVAQTVARTLEISTVHAGVLPGDKVERIRQLRREGRRVAMVGDGVNDAAAMLSADVSVAIGAGTSVAVEAGDVVLVRNDPRDVVSIIRLSRVTYRKMVQNLWWAAGYNVVAIPLAAGVLAPWGVVLTPTIAALLMSASTLVVAANAQLIRREPLA